MKLRETIREYAAEGFFANVLALSAVQACRKTLPLLTLPYLARVLGPDGWGLLTFFQSFAACVTVVIEFGFGLSGSRDVARSRHSPSELSEVVSGVFGAQALIAAVVLVAACLLAFWIAPLGAHPALAGAALLWAVAEGCCPFWYFVGIEKMSVIATLEIATKILATGGVFLYVRAPGDGARVLLLQAGASALSWAVARHLISRRHAIAPMSAALVRRSLKAGWPMFVIRGTESLYTVGNAFLLGMLAPAAAVGFFAGPEKISRALFGLFNPVRDVLYPRISSLSLSAPQKAVRLARAGTVATIVAGLLIGAGVFLTAPLLIRLALGPGFAEAVPVLRLLGMLPAILAVIQSVSLQWLLPQGRESTLTRITLIAGAAHLSLVFLWAPRYAHMGMAWAVLASQTLACIMGVAAAWRSDSKALGTRMPAPECARSI
jgi:polysaccharide transporter, PST family